MLNVFAGSVRNRRSMGIVVVATAIAQVPRPEIARPSSWLSMDYYPTPGTGGLAITRARGKTVTLEALDGSKWVFDVSQRTLRMIRGRRRPPFAF